MSLPLRAEFLVYDAHVDVTKQYRIPARAKNQWSCADRIDDAKHQSREISDESEIQHKKSTKKEERWVDLSETNYAQTWK